MKEYYYNINSAEPNPWRVCREIKKYLKSKNNWKETDNINCDFSHCKENGKIKYGIKNLNYSKIANKEENYNLFKNCYYYPETYLVDISNNNDLYFIKKMIDTRNGTWFLKPKFGGKGKGIEILDKNYNFKNLCNLKNKNNIKKYILQNGVMNIHLYKNRKYDLRVNVIYLKHKKNIIPYLFSKFDIRVAPDNYNNLKNNKNILTIQEDSTHNVLPHDSIKELETKSSDIFNIMKDTSKKVCLKIKKNLKNIDDKTEFWIGGYDLLPTKNFEFKLLEFNCSINLLQSESIKPQHIEMLKCIVDEIIIPVSETNEVKTNKLKLLL